MCVCERDRGGGAGERARMPPFASTAAWGTRLPLEPLIILLVVVTV